MSDLRDLYQDLILDHAKRPRNFGTIEGPRARHAEGYNPLCGDHFNVHVVVEEGVVKDARFEGSGCAISTASASVMTETVKGRSEADVEGLFRAFQDLVTGQRALPAEVPGKLAVFSGVSEYPARVKCASLAWHAMSAALKNQHDVVTTE